uniref:Uncharacterized protein n=1 Tax=Oryza sativa subsp. japonica TaxID=39947 RepID=Q6Z5Q2_ORYSJ|nr:hypothetical protein [Oryza sativa Japonica Group]
MEEWRWGQLPRNSARRSRGAGREALRQRMEARRGGLAGRHGGVLGLERRLGNQGGATCRRRAGAPNLLPAQGRRPNAIANTGLGDIME